MIKPNAEAQRTQRFAKKIKLNSLRFSAFSAPLRFSPSVLIHARRSLVWQRLGGQGLPALPNKSGCHAPVIGL
jgi:hypothetical protein